MQDVHKIRNQTFQKNIRNLMSKKRINQADIANALGISKATVARWCNGEMFPHGETLLKLATFLSVTPNMLITNRDTLQQLDEERLLAGYRMLSPQGRQLALQRMDELKQLYWYGKDGNE